jgi:hypothetical protein
MRFVTAFIVCILAYTHPVYAHEMTPTYPVLRPSIIDGLSVTQLNLFNRRQDATYYEIGVFDEDWNPISFASGEKIIKLNYLAKKSFEVYIRKADEKRVEYVCTTSKLEKSVNSTSMISSKICSKIKRE